MRQLVADDTLPVSTITRTREPCIRLQPASPISEPMAGIAMPPSCPEAPGIGIKTFS